MLHRYFAWARQRKLILIDPARPLRPGPQLAFTGTVLDTTTQRALLRRWTSPAAHPHERLAGLLALLHAASSAQIRALTITGTDRKQRTLALTGRPFPTPADPATWAAAQACLAHRDLLATLNPHVIVTGTTRTSDAPADGSYLASGSPRPAPPCQHAGRPGSPSSSTTWTPSSPPPHSACATAAWSATSPTTSPATGSTAPLPADNPGT